MKNKGKIQTSKSIAKNIPVQEQGQILYSLSKTENFLNNQKYIFWKSEERKVLATFLSQNTIQMIVSYLWLIDILFYFILWGIFICAMDGNTVSWFTIFIVSIMLPTILWGFYVYYVFQWKIPFSKNEITNVKEYFQSNNKGGNKILWLIFLVGTWVGFCVTLTFLGIGPIVYIIILLPLYIIWEDIFREHSCPSYLLPFFTYSFKKVVLFSFIVLLIAPIYIIAYIIFRFTKYQTYKLQPKWKMMQNFGFLEKNVWWNGFYEIIKK